MTVPANEVVVHPVPPATSGVRVFRWQDQQLYFGVPASHVPFYRNLIGRGIVKNLVERGLLIETEPTSLQVPEYDIVLKPRQIPFVSHAEEWCAPMLRDAAKLVLDVRAELERVGLTLQDGHPWNVLVDGCRPVYADLGSIVAGPARAGWDTDFARMFLNPLRLLSRGQSRLARLVLGSCAGISDEEIAEVTGRSPVRRLLKKLRRGVGEMVPRSHHSTLRRLGSKVQAPSVRGSTDGIERLRRKLEALTFPQPTTAWSNYGDETAQSLNDPSRWVEKQRQVDTVLSRTRPGTVLDIGSNRGFYSHLAVRHGGRAVAFDLDEPAVSKLYFDTRREDGAILPLVMNICHPTGWRGAPGALPYPPAIERLKCEMVLALALTHHLTFKEKMSFAETTKALAVFAERWLLTEFIPAEDEIVRGYGADGLAWYTLDDFIATLKSEFRSVETLPSTPPGRVLLLCER
jgi:hypothetical protein